MRSGPKPGFRHTQETREKIRNARLGKVQDAETRHKISEALSGKSKTSNHRDHISQSMLDPKRKCWNRYIELVETYPEYEQFFKENKEDLLFFLQDIKSDRELDDILRYYETANYEYCCKFPYQYESSSVYAQEDAMIRLLDTATYLRKFH